MKKIALMFPGQGSQYLNMGREFYDNFETARKIFETANNILGYNLTNIIFGDDEQLLNQTNHTQVALLTVEIAMLKTFQEQYPTIKFEAVIGHSLGEYSAYVASGRLSFEEALKITAYRGKLMSEISIPNLGMAAILKLDVSSIQSILQENTSKKEVVIANYNSPLQTVISGNKTLIENIITEKINLQKGRVVNLPVSGAFHSHYMNSITPFFKEMLIKFSFKNSSINLYSNLNAMPIKEGEEVDSLTAQIDHCVLFMQSIENMEKDGFNTFIEIGPRKVLQGLVKKINPNVSFFGIETIEDLKKIKEGTYERSTK